MSGGRGSNSNITLRFLGGQCVNSPLYCHTACHELLQEGVIPQKRKVVEIVRIVFVCCVLVISFFDAMWQRTKNGSFTPFCTACETGPESFWAGLPAASHPCPFRSENLPRR